jgi:GT2 family glycosyltransferase
LGKTADAFPIKLSIIIVNWNTADLLKKCLNSIIENIPEFSYEIIVFDNGSEGHSRKVLQEFSEVRKIYNDKNIGFAAANNQAVKHSIGEYILFLNPDTEIHSDILTPAIKFLENSSYGILGVRLRLPNGEIQISSGNFPSIKTMIFQTLYLRLLKLRLVRMITILAQISGVQASQLLKNNQLWDPFQVNPVDWVSGAFLILHRNDFLESGMFDEQFFVFAEEFDLCYRLKLRGIRAVFWGKDEIIHHSGASTKKFPIVNFLQRFSANLRFYVKHYSGVEVLVYRFFVILGYSLAGIFLFFKALVSSKSKRKKIYQKYKAYFKLVAQFLQFRIDKNDNPKKTEFTG